MARNVYTLLVGIDNYPSPVNSLRGCVNDIRRVETLLNARLSGPEDALHQKVLLDEHATRQAVIDGFRRHLAQARAGDTALFYYSGHGSQEPAPPEFWPVEPDHLDETLVCYDSRLPGRWDLADKELAKLIAEVAAGGAHVAVILDCCHSGSGTRGDQPAGAVRVRRVPTDSRIRPLDAFLIGPDEAVAMARDGAQAHGSDWCTLPAGRHVLLAACRPEEEAQELFLGNEPRGAFSYYLLNALERPDVSLTYRDILKYVNARVRARVANQAPQMEASVLADLDQPFLGGAIAAGPRYFTVSYDKRRGWVVDAGAAQGLPSPQGSETTAFALFPLNSDLAKLESLSGAVGQAQVTAVYPATSAVQLTLADGAQPDQETSYKAVVVALPLPPLIVALRGDAAALELVRTALAHSGADGGPSLLVREGALHEATLVLDAVAGGYQISRQGDRFALVAAAPGFAPDQAQLAVQRLEHMARWMKIVELDNPGSQIPASAVRLEILQPDASGQWQPVATEAGVRLEYALSGGVWQQPQFKVRMTNTSRRRLYCMLLDLPESFGVFPLLSGSGGVWLEPGQTAWANDGQPLYAEILDSLWQSGVTEFSETLKLVVSTEECDATLLAQDDLPVSPAAARGDRSPGVLNTLTRLMNRVGVRHLSARPAASEAFVDWTAAEVAFSIFRPLEAAPLAGPGAQTSLGSGVSIQGHPALQAQARLSSLPEAGRAAGNLVLPALLRDQPEIVQPFAFTSSRGGEPGASVIELSDVNDYQLVTREAPLIIQVEQALGQDERLLLLGFDGEFYLPLGRVERHDASTVVRLERLPAPTALGARDLKGSIRILFQKLVGGALGQPFDYPHLSIATVDEAGKVQYNYAADAVTAAVAKADKILLYVHGIIGDTRAMVLSAHAPWLELSQAVPSLADRYDLILAFDYENIHTSIRENARLLKQRLRAVGLGPEHGKTLDVVGHSMGGLIVRWLIERENGRRVVHHLVMVGTPNAGSPWPTVEDWATAAIGLGMNVMTAASWPAQAIGVLAGALEMVDVSLDEMRPGSGLLQELEASDDPGVSYTVVAGSTSLVASALQPAPGERTSRFERLWQHIKPPHWFLHDISAPLFFGQPNDIAVSVTSAQAVARNRNPQPVFLPLSACDHISYFGTAAGVTAVADAAAG